MTRSLDTFKSRRTLTAGGKTYAYYSLTAAEKNGLKGISKLPYSLKVLLENLLRYEDGNTVTADDIRAIAGWLSKKTSDREIAFRPARVLMQDLTGVPAVVDLAAMRDAMKKLGGDPEKINPLAEVDLVIDHSVMVDNFGGKDSFKKNVVIEYERNMERYQFLRWGQQAFANFRVVPPGTGICHQVNLEYLARTVWTRKDKVAVDGKQATMEVAYPDTLVGADSHTTMVNGLSVLGWGVGGIEAEAAMLGQPLSMVLPEVIGFKLTGRLKEGVTATDLVLTVTEALRKRGVVGRFVEFYGPGVGALALADRATIANMAPEYGATCGFFPVDGETLNYLRLSGRDPDRIKLVEAYAKEQGMWLDHAAPDPVFTDTLELDLSTVEPSLAGPRRPQDRVPLSDAKRAFGEALGSFGVDYRNGSHDQAVADTFPASDPTTEQQPGGVPEPVADGPATATVAAAKPRSVRVSYDGAEFELHHGAVVIAAITSCTNTSNPSVMLGAGLLAKKAAARGLRSQPWVKTSLAPGSKVVTEYLTASGTLASLEQLGFDIVGYGCTTCIGNSGPLPKPVSKAIDEGKLVAAAVLSGNRNFEGRVHPHVRANYLASPPLVVAYALAGRVDIDFDREPLGTGSDGKPVHLRDIWPSQKEVADAVAASVKPEMFAKSYGNVFDGNPRWNAIPVGGGELYPWNASSTYIHEPPFFQGLTLTPKPLTDVVGARVLVMVADSVTTDHISPAGDIALASPAGKFLAERGIEKKDFNSYGSRRGNDLVMVRGTFANIRLKNLLVPGSEGNVTVHFPSNAPMPIYDASEKYQAAGTPLVVLAGKEYGTGSSRDWAAKGTLLLGVRAVLAESFERIHRSNLVGMGILPLVYEPGQTADSLGLTGREAFDITGLTGELKPRQKVKVRATREDGSVLEFSAIARLDTPVDVDYYKNGGILQTVLRGLVKV